MVHADIFGPAPTLTVEMTSVPDSTVTLLLNEFATRRNPVLGFTPTATGVEPTLRYEDELRTRNIDTLLSAGVSHIDVARYGSRRWVEAKYQRRAW